MRSFLGGVLASLGVAMGIVVFGGCFLSGAYFATVLAHDWSHFPWMITAVPVLALLLAVVDVAILSGLVMIGVEAPKLAGRRRPLVPEKSLFSWLGARALRNSGLFLAGPAVLAITTALISRSPTFTVPVAFGAILLAVILASNQALRVMGRHDQRSE